MSLNLDEALDATRTERGPRSHLERWMSTLEPADAQKVATALNTPGIEASHLGRALTDLARKSGFLGAGQKISGQSIQNWRSTNGS